MLCNTTISCAMDGASAVKRHAGIKKHLEARAKHIDGSGVLQAPKIVQATIDFSQGRPPASLQDRVVKSEAVFAMSVISKSIPYSLADTATEIYKVMVSDSEVAKNFSCGRHKLTCVISDGLGPYFNAKVVNELCQAGVFFSVLIDETPKPEQRVQQLDVQARYFSESKQQVTIEHLMSFNLGRPKEDIIVERVEDALPEVPRNRFLCFYSDGPKVMKNVKAKLKRRVNENWLDVGLCSLHKVHNAFLKGLDVFCSDVEELLCDVY